MSFLALTKYPPSLLFLMPTIGTGCLLLALFETCQDSKIMPMLAMLGVNHVSRTWSTSMNSITSPRSASIAISRAHGTCS